MIIYMLAGIMQTIDKWNEKLNGFFNHNANNAAFGTIVLVSLFAIGCWAIKYFSKK